VSAVQAALAGLFVLAAMVLLQPALVDHDAREQTGDEDA
jgi:hypothetical protein